MTDRNEKAQEILAEAQEIVNNATDTSGIVKAQGLMLQVFGGNEKTRNMFDDTQRAIFAKMRELGIG